MQAHLRARNPKVTPARVVSGPTLLTGICFCAECGGAMTLRTGKGGRYRYYTCSIKARQGETGCKGRSIPMEKLDDLVARHLEDRLLDDERLEEILASLLDRRQERTERRREHIAELNKRAAETELRLKRLYDAIESGIADLDDPALKDRIAALKAVRDQSQIDADRAKVSLEGAGTAITPALLKGFANAARTRIRLPGGGYRRDHLRALAQRVEVAASEVRIMGSKSDLLRTLTAAAGVKSATPGVRSSVLKWRTERDSNPRTAYHRYTLSRRAPSTARPSVRPPGWGPERAGTIPAVSSAARTECTRGGIFARTGDKTETGNAFALLQLQHHRAREYADRSNVSNVANIAPSPEGCVEAIFANSLRTLDICQTIVPPISPTPSPLPRFAYSNLGK